jgi:MFS family permease
LREARFSQVVLMAVGLFTTMDTYIVTLLIEPIKHELHLTDVQVGLANTTALFGVYGLLCIPMGVLADRCNRVRMLIGAIMLWCIGLFVTGLSTNLALLVTGKALLGVANAASTPATLSVMADYFAPERRSMAISSFGMGQVIGQAAAILVGGLGFAALDHLALSNPGALFGLSAWRAISLLFALGGLALLPFLFTMREPARQEVIEGKRGSFRELWAFRRFLFPVIAGTACVSGMAVGVLNWVPAVLTRIYGQQPGDFAGWFSAVTLAAGLIGMIAAGKILTVLQRRMGRRKMTWPAAIALACCAPASLMAVMPSLYLFAACALVFIIGYAVAAAVVVIAMSFSIPNELRGAATGLNVVTVSIASGLAAPLVAVTGGMSGGDANLGRAMGIVGLSLAVLGCLCFIRASSGSGQNNPAIPAPPSPSQA